MPAYCDITKLDTYKANPETFMRNGANGSLGNDQACYSSYQLGTTREKLDASLESVHRPMSSISGTFDSNYQTTMLTGLVWAALGTTVLYYAFTKI